MNATCTDIQMPLVLYNSFLEDVSKCASCLPQPLQLYLMETAPPSPKVLTLTGVVHPCTLEWHTFAYYSLLYKVIQLGQIHQANLLWYTNSLYGTMTYYKQRGWFREINRFISRFNHKGFIIRIIISSKTDIKVLYEKTELVYTTRIKAKWIVGYYNTDSIMWKHWHLHESKFTFRSQLLMSGFIMSQVIDNTLTCKPTSSPLVTEQQAKPHAILIRKIKPLAKLWRLAFSENWIRQKFPPT